MSRAAVARREALHRVLLSILVDGARPHPGRRRGWRGDRDEAGGIPYAPVLGARVDPVANGKGLRRLELSASL